MPKAAPILLSFSSGELSRLFDGRVDLEEYPSGCRQMENFIPVIQGPAVRRGGTRFVREVKDSGDRTGWLRFEFNVEQAYFLEVGDQYIRFYTDHAIVMNGTNPLELATPWVAADLFDADGNFQLRAVQSGDILYITHTAGTYEPQKLTRSGALSWSIADLSQDGGPFEDIDPDATITVYSSANTGSVTLTASSAIFNSNHIGALFLLEQRNLDDTKAWEAGKAVTVSPPSIRAVDGRNYQALNAATTGGIVPSHVRGAVFDGNAGVQWQFLDPGYGWGRITGIGSGGTTAAMTVLSRIPDGAVGSGELTTRWAFGSWSDALGWPTHVSFFRSRLTFARATTRQIWMSVAGDFENFSDRNLAGEIVADSAITVEVESDKVNRIEWLAPADRLLVGTAGGEFAVGEITSSEPLGPGNVKCVPQTAYGSKPVRPVLVGESLLFVQRSGRKLRDLNYALATEGYISTNLSVLAPHLLPRGYAITGLAYQQEPYSVIWAMRSDGQLLGTTINANQKRFGWHRHLVGGDGIVEAIETLPHPDGDADELWMIVRRTINGSTKRYVEYMEPELGEGEDVLNAFYVDSGLSYDGAKAQILTPGTGADVVGTTLVTFAAASSVFVAGNVGKEIRYRYQDADEEWHTARAEITTYVSGFAVKATIISAWPSLDPIPASGWRVTASTISGLSHLAGETVKVLVDGASHPDCTVASGSISLVRQGALVHVGLAYTSKLQTMGLEAGAQDGTSQGKIKRVHHGVIRLLNTVGGSAGPSDGSVDEIQFRDAGMSMDEAIPPFTGDKDIAWPDGYTKDATLYYENDQPLPATVIAFMPRLVTSQP